MFYLTVLPSEDLEPGLAAGCRINLREPIDVGAMKSDVWFNSREVVFELCLQTGQRVMRQLLVLPVFAELRHAKRKEHADRR